MIPHKLFYSLLAVAITAFAATSPAVSEMPSASNNAMEAGSHYQTATLAGGCFW